MRSMASYEAERLDSFVCRAHVFLPPGCLGCSDNLSGTTSVLSFHNNLRSFCAQTSRSISQPPAPSSSFEWSPGLIIGIAGAAVALFCMPITVYLILRWRHLERRRAESSEAGMRRGRSSKDRAAVPQRKPVVGIAEGRVDLAIWSPIRARRGGFVVLPELAYRPDEKVCCIIK